MAQRKGTNVSLPPEQKRFVHALVANGRYRTASEVVRHALRLLEQEEHRRLLEKWIYDGLSEAEEAQLPEEVKENGRKYFRRLVDEALEDIRAGRVGDGPAALARIRDELLESDRHS